MKIENKTDARGGIFSASNGDELMGQMSYVFGGPSLFIIDHTNVGHAFSGQGVGTALVEAAVEYARKDNYKIIPTCPFARSVFMKNKDLGDVLARQS